MNSFDTAKANTCKKIALTFDDGPGDHTDRLLDVLARHGGRGTFFVIGDGLEEKSELLQRIAAEGHEIGNHTLSHSYLPCLGDEDMEKELSVTNEKISSIVKKVPGIARPPYGAYNEEVGAQGEKLGLSFIAWSLDTLDWQSKDAADVCEKIMTQVKSGDIILCHDPHESTVDAMEKVIPLLCEKGFRLVTVTELMNSNSIPLEAGKLYYNAYTE